MNFLDKAIQSVENADKILIGPLNWGLGHASRCIPIIEALLARNKTIILASDGQAAYLLKETFPDLKLVNLPGYNIHYPYQSMVLNLLRQSLNIFKAIGEENKVVQQIITSEEVDLIISDNRYGVYSSKVKSIFLGHQLQIIHKNPAIAKTGTFVQKRMIASFDEIWIPDFPPGNSIAPRLSKICNRKEHQYIGPISRLKKCNLPVKRKYLVILSGPEPRRSELEKKLVALLDGKDYLLVQGITGKNRNKGNLVSYLLHNQLSSEIAQSEIVVCRSGYSSIMDLLILQKKAILIPTPGQTEQEYLGTEMQKRYSELFSVIKEEEIGNFHW
jgi:uncharacterized protein (TIGR00661 family)